MTDIVQRLRAHVAPQWGSAGVAMREAADEIERLREELAICRDAIEVCFNVAESLPSDDDGDAAIRRTTLRRLNEAIGKAAPRLLMERAEGQRLYGLRYRELMEENERPLAASRAQHWADIKHEHELSLRGQPPEVLKVMDLVDGYCDLRAGLYTPTHYDNVRRMRIVEELHRVIQPVPLTDEQRDALITVLDHYGNDPRVECLYSLVRVVS
jgi:hypothetical protein